MKTRIKRIICTAILAASCASLFTGCDKTVGGNKVRVGTLTHRFEVISGAGKGKAGVWEYSKTADMDGDGKKEKVYIATVTNSGDLTLSEQYYVFGSSKNNGKWKYQRKY
ncbi:MAG: hypothetical protein IKH78_04375 [Ruminococcus sp.]|nr:hypothetical protein [Ruminococcus sp.]